MPTFQELAGEYANYMIVNQNNPHVVSEIANRILRLTYTDSGDSLTDSDKEDLLLRIRTEIQGAGKKEAMLIKEAEDITALLAMVNKIKNITKGK